MLRVCIYKGYGMYEQDGKILFKLLSKYVCAKKYSVTYISSEDILSGALNQKTSLFVIGGGFDLGIMKGSKGMTLIKDYVRNGGSYLGICCGAYFACDYIEFDKGGLLEVIGERFLKFYPGHSYGPLYKSYDYKTRTGAAASLITLQSELKPDGQHYMSQIPVISTRPNAKENVNREPGKNANLTMYSEALFENHGISRQFKVYFNGGGWFVEKNEDIAMKTRQAEGYNLAPGIESHEGKTMGQGLKSQGGCTTVKGKESCDVDTTMQGIESQGGNTMVKGIESCDVDTTMQGVESQGGNTTVKGKESCDVDTKMQGVESQGGNTMVKGIESCDVETTMQGVESQGGCTTVKGKESCGVDTTMQGVESQGGCSTLQGIESCGVDTTMQGVESQGGNTMVKGMESCDVDTTMQGVESQGGNTMVKGMESCDVDTTIQGVESQGGNTMVKGIESLESNPLCRQEQVQRNSTLQLEFENVTILARYADLESKPAAIVKCLVDKGTAILSGVHFEYDAVDIDDGDPLVKDIIPELRNSAVNRKYLMLLILRHLKISTQENY